MALAWSVWVWMVLATSKYLTPPAPDAETSTNFAGADGTDRTDRLHGCSMHSSSKIPRYVDKYQGPLMDTPNHL